MTYVKLTYSNGAPVAQLWSCFWTILLDTVWFRTVEEARSCIKPGSYDLVWDCLG
jgi:hypothetical protein